MSEVPVVPVWTSPLKVMPPVEAVVLCLLRHHSTNTIQEHSLRHAKEDDQSWRTPDGSELSYDWEVLCWKAEDPRVDIHAASAKVHELIKKCSTDPDMGTAVFLGDAKDEDHQVVMVNKKDLEQIAEAMRSLIFAPSGGFDSSDRERLLWCARTIRAIVDRDDKQPLGYTWWSQAIMVVGAIKRVLNMTDEEFAAENVRPIQPVSVEAQVRRVLEQNLGDAYYCVKDWSAWQTGKMRASDFVALTSSMNGRVDGLTVKLIKILN